MNATCGEKKNSEIMTKEIQRSVGRKRRKRGLRGYMFGGCQNRRMVIVKRVVVWRTGCRYYMLREPLQRNRYQLHYVCVGLRTVLVQQRS